MVAPLSEVVNDEVPPTDSAVALDCVKLPSVLTVRLPPTFDAPKTRPPARSLVKLASLPVPLVVSDTAPLSRLALLSVIVAPLAEVVNDEVPPTVRAVAPDCVKLPSVLTVRLPPTFDAPKTRPPARSLVKLASLPVPLVVSDTAPLSRLALLSVIVAPLAEVVNDEVPPTVKRRSATGCRHHRSP